MRILEYGDAGLLIEVDDLDTVMALHAALAEHPLPGVEDVVPAARTILLRLTPGTTGPESGKPYATCRCDPPQPTRSEKWKFPSATTAQTWPTSRQPPG